MLLPLSRNSSAKNGSVCKQWQLTCVCRPRRLSRPGLIRQPTPELFRYTPCWSTSDDKWAVNVCLWLRMKITRLTAPQPDENIVNWWTFVVAQKAKTCVCETKVRAEKFSILLKCIFFASCSSIRLLLSLQTCWCRVEDNHLLIFQISHPNHNTHQTISPYN